MSPDAASPIIVPASFVFGYLMGSIPFGLIITQLAGTQDIRSIGSGNIGATNVLRTGRKRLAAATLICDILKATLPILLLQYLYGAPADYAAAIGAFLGHLFPLWLKFKGGKGVATYLGAALGLFWPAALAFVIVWLAIAAIFRYSSLAALCAALAVPLFVWWMEKPELAMLLAFMSALLWIMHRANIARLMRGTEGRIGAKG